MLCKVGLGLGIVVSNACIISEESKDPRSKCSLDLIALRSILLQSNSLVPSRIYRYNLLLAFRYAALKPTRSYHSVLNLAPSVVVFAPETDSSSFCGYPLCGAYHLYDL